MPSSPRRCGLWLALALMNGVWLVSPSLAAPLKPIPTTANGGEPAIQPVPSPEGATGGRQRAVTMTRWVRVFHDLEWDLIEALRGPGTAQSNVLARLLAEDFEQRNARDPSVPEPRDEWLASQPFRGRAEAGLNLSAMAVHDHGNTAVVSFRLTGLPGGPQFIVDVWRKQPDNSFQLMTRYAAPAALNSSVPPESAAPRAPDGKG